MKLLNRIVIITLFLFTASVLGISVNGRFVVVKSDSAKLSLLLQINTSTGNDDMGGATIVIEYDKNILSFNSNPEVDKDYKFINLSGGNYNDATVTRPLSNKIWINIDLPKENNNKGTVVSGEQGWTDVVTLNFYVLSLESGATVKWLQNNIFWQIYDADNSTSWLNGSFTDMVNVPITVELLNFTAELLDENNIQLDWSTVSKAYNNGYDIERNLSSTDPNWEKIGFVKSKSILYTPVDYSFTDDQAPTSENIKYRLTSVNNDGTFNILGEIEVVKPIESFELYQNYPNPFNPTTKISYTILPTNDNVQSLRVVLKVFDILGNEITTLVDEVQELGHHEVEFNAFNLTSGVYLYRIEAGSFSSIKKMMLLK